jgi:beta-lactamase superfamily II metal-dependent hydrolase
LFKLRIVQADFGDCFILEYGTEASPRFLLIDGGPEDVYRDHLRRQLRQIRNDGGKLDLVNVSHVDGDHIVGLLDLFAELREERANGEQETIEIDHVWHNSFAVALDPDGSIHTRLATALAAAGTATMPMAMNGFLGISQGNRFRVNAIQLGLPLNQQFPNELICVDEAPNTITFGNLSLSIVGPTRANLDALKAEWAEWLDVNEEDLATADPRVMRNSDQSVPNLSSVMMIAKAHDKTILFTGDGRSDHLIDGLEAAGFLDDEGELQVDVLKVPHHGSDRNATKTFFKKVTADTYVISANGHPDNPDLATLIWIVEAAKQQERQIDIIATNQRSTLTKLLEEYPEAEFGYDLKIMPSHHHIKTVTLA